MIKTTHIQEMLLEALNLAKAVDGLTGDTVLALSQHTGLPTAVLALERAEVLAFHSCAELADEITRTKGWT